MLVTTSCAAWFSSAQEAVLLFLRDTFRLVAAAPFDILFASSVDSRN
jgi:hypothetical protein